MEAKVADFTGAKLVLHRDDSKEDPINISEDTTFQQFTTISPPSLGTSPSKDPRHSPNMHPKPPRTHHRVSKSQIVLNPISTGNFFWHDDISKTPESGSLVDLTAPYLP